MRLSDWTATSAKASVGIAAMPPSHARAIHGTGADRKTAAAFI
jgi:hypothetical protein